MTKSVSYMPSVFWVATVHRDSETIPMSLCSMISDLWGRDIETVKTDVAERIVILRKRHRAVEIAHHEEISFGVAERRAEQEANTKVEFA
jgi:hypothetical protein